MLLTMRRLHIEKLQSAAATLCELVERLGGSVPEDIKALTSLHA